MQRALLFLNGQAPRLFPDRNKPYTLVACTDGAYSNYLIHQSIPVDYIIGDLDSLVLPTDSPHPHIIHTPDQNKTDFEKALLFLISKNITHVDIYGVSGNASDHFLGNLSVGLTYYEQISMTFFDDYSTFFFTSKNIELPEAKNKTLSIMPFPTARGVTLTGFMYPLKNATLTLGGLISLRNQTEDLTPSLQIDSGVVLIFINNT